MPGEGVEPSRPEGHPILSRARLTGSATPAVDLSVGSARPGSAAWRQVLLGDPLRPLVAVLLDEAVERRLVESRALRHVAAPADAALSTGRGIGRRPGRERNLLVQIVE